MIRTPARRPLAALTSLLFLGLSGCYAYAPVEGAAPDAGAEVRLRLNDAGADRVATQTFLSQRDVVEGRIVERRGNELRLLVSRPARQDFVSGGRRSDTVAVPLSGVEGTELKSLEAGKTGALVGGVALGMGLLGAVLVSSGGGGGAPPGGGDGQPLNISIPLSIP